MKTLPTILLFSLSLLNLSAAEPERATFAAGCFWCVESIYEAVPGVLDAVSGYAGGELANPTYQQHGDHTETVDLSFDPDKVSYEALLRIFWNSHDITDGSGVAPDFGRSYRPAIFYHSAQQLATLERIKAELQKGLDRPIATEILPFKAFWPAEDYHQDFVKRKPNNSYVRNVSVPRVRETLKK